MACGPNGHPWQSAAQFFFFLPKLFMELCHELCNLNSCCFSFSFPQSAAQFFFFLPKLFMAHAMNGMCNLNACRPWQSAAQFFFFLPKLFMALCHEWHVDKSKCMPSMAECCPIFLFPSEALHGMNGMHLNACHPWQSAAQFFFFLPKLFMALCHERHVQSKCMPSMAECCPIFLFPSQTLHGTLP